MDSKEQYKKVLNASFGEGADMHWDTVLQENHIHRIETGEYLFKQGSLDDSFYLVLSGRFRVVQENEKGHTILGDVAVGEPVGEFALFTHETRMASVIAMRPSAVLKLNREMYLNILKEQPSLGHGLAEFVVKRLRRNEMQKHLQATPKNIAVVSLLKEEKLLPFMEQWIKPMEELLPGVQVLPAHDQIHLTQDKLYELVETAPGINLLVCHQIWDDWSKLCLLYSDLVVIVADVNGSPALTAFENDSEIYRATMLNKKKYLVLVHPEDATMPTSTLTWLELRNPDLHLHIRNKNARDFRRLSRILLQKATGLVLGGGGAKGFAHVGVVKALREAGIEIDFLGGTSSGALYGLGMAFCDFEEDKIDYHLNNSVKAKLTSRDYTFPLISIMTGKKFTRFLKKMYGETNLEDFWIPVYCVSTNFTNASMQVHTRGPAWQQIKASIAIPGIFPPEIIDHQLYVDGGVVDNLPVEPMYQYPVSHIMAISLSANETKQAKFDTMPGTWALMWDGLTGHKKYHLPGLASLIVHSLMVNSRAKQKAVAGEVSVYIELDLKNIGFIDDSQWKTAIKLGYEQTKNYLLQLPENEKFWNKTI